MMAKRIGAASRGVRWRLTVSIATFFVAWEIIGQAGSYAAIKPVSEVMPELWRLFTQSSDLMWATLGTLAIALVGYTISVVVGVTVGYLIATSHIASSSLIPLINAAYATPVYMVIPLLGIYTGLEFFGKVTLVVLFSVFVIIINTMTGVQQVSSGLLEMAESFRFSPIQKVARVILPSASPYIATGMRLGLGLSIQGAIVGELLLRVDKLGLLLLNAGSSFQIAKLLAVSFFIAMLAASAMLAARLAERRVIRWPR